MFCFVFSHAPSRSDFLSLPFQAIECSLAGVNPAGEVWSDQALDDFERLTYVAEWRPLLAKLCSYTHSEVSSWPSVQLYDNSEGKGRNGLRWKMAVNYHSFTHFLSPSGSYSPVILFSSPYDCQHLNFLGWWSLSGCRARRGEGESGPCCT